AEGQARPEVGTTVNVTVASGGSTSNVIAERATARLDVRVPTSAESDRVGEALRSYAPRDPRVRVSVSGGLNRPPLEQTPANRALWEEARAAGAALGLDLAGAAVGGGSDGSFASAVGTATLDGLGGVGAGPHA